MNIFATIALTLLVIGLVWIVGGKKKALITSIECIEMAETPTYIVHFDRPMNTNAVPEILLTPPEAAKVGATEWQTPEALKIAIEPPAAVQIQIKNAKTAEGGKLVPYAGELQLR